MSEKNGKKTSKKTRRPRGSGSVIERANGYEASIQLGKDAAGKPIRKTRLLPSEREAERWLLEIRSAHLDAYQLQKAERTLNHYLTVREHLKSGNLPETVAKARSEMEYLRSELGHLRMQDITRSDIANFWKKLNAERTPDTSEARSATTGTQQVGHSRRMRGKTREHLRGAYRLAIADGAVTENLADSPTAKLALPRSEEQPKALSPANTRALLEAAKGTPHYALFYTALSLGLRRGELFALKWDALHEQEGLLRIERFWRPPSEKGKARIVFYGKTQKANRTLPVPKGVMQVLQRHKEQQAEAAAVLGTDYRNQGLVFANEFGGTLDAKTVNENLRNLAQGAGVHEEDLPTLQYLRTTYVSLNLRAGVKLEIVSRRMGHESVLYTLEKYRHLYADEGRTGVFAVDDLLGLGDPRNPRSDHLAAALETALDYGDPTKRAVVDAVFGDIDGLARKLARELGGNRADALTLLGAGGDDRERPTNQVAA